MPSLDEETFDCSWLPLGPPRTPVLERSCRAGGGHQSLHACFIREVLVPSEQRSVVKIKLRWERESTALIVNDTHLHKRPLLVRALQTLVRSEGYACLAQLKIDACRKWESGNNECKMRLLLTRWVLI